MIRLSAFAGPVQLRWLRRGLLVVAAMAGTIYLADFAAKHESDKVVGILRKTWAKMSPLGRRAALALPFDGALAAILAAALADEAVSDEAVSDEATSPGATQPV